ncbi:uncharacterized protein EI97DRAFT_354873, partial [Westerdykella ornata]
MLQLLQRATSPPKHTLTELRPTPSTVQYTVSTRTAPTTLPQWTRYYFFILLRIFLGVCALLALGLKWAVHAGYHSHAGWWKWICDTIFGAHKARVIQSVEAAQWRYFIPCAVFVLYLVLRRGYTEEALLILPSLGLQTLTSSPTYFPFLSAPTTRFIPTPSIQDIFIHEAFRGFEVRFYLAVVVKGEPEVVVVFPKLLPRRAVLERVWRGVRDGLWEGGG